MKLGFIGVGNMASAMIAGLKEYEIIASDISEQQLNSAKQKYNIQTGSNTDVTSADIIFIAVKPQDITSVLTEISPKITNQIIISIAAGVSINKIESIVGNKKIVRVMPNTPALVQEMAAGYSVNNLTEEDKQTVNSLLNKLGTAILLDENQLDAVTALSGSGPAFIARILDYFSTAGEQIGLDKQTSYKLALKTFLGTVKLLEEKQMKPEELITMVSSPGGTTVAGREILESSELQNIILKTLMNAKKRSEQLNPK